MCFFSHTLALHRPTNGAAAIIPNEIPNAICIQHLLSPWGLDRSFRVEPAGQSAKCCVLLQLIPHYRLPEPPSISHLRVTYETGVLSGPGFLSPSGNLSAPKQAI